MITQEKEWKIINTKTVKNQKEIVDILLENRDIKSNEEKKEFLNPIKPEKIGLIELGISKKSVEKSINRIEKAIKDNEQMIIYGDYDADGVCATAILWETLYKLTKNVSPYIPDRFSEGYGIKTESVSKLKFQNSNLKLIITVDNGIVASDAIKMANSLGIDVIITDHHQKSDALPNSYSIIHTDKLSGSGIAWIFSREIRKYFSPHFQPPTSNFSPELAAIGTIADQLPLVGPNRSIAKYGLEALSKTKRPGLIELFKESGIDTVKEIGTYEVNYLIAPRLNAMGRITHAIDSLRLLCTTNSKKAKDLAELVGKTNRERQHVVEKVITESLLETEKNDFKGPIVIAGEYHEGVIGLAAGKIAEKFYRPAIVISKGKNISKASARSIPGFNIIKAIREVGHLIEGGGGHPMAAGFSINTENILKFIIEFNKISEPLLSDEVLQKKLKIDMQIEPELIDEKLVDELKQFNPVGMGNPAPVFALKSVETINAKTVGSDAKHLKMNIVKGKKTLSAIAFGMGHKLTDLDKDKKADVAFNIEENMWNGNKTLQLKVKDLKLTV